MFNPNRDMKINVIEKDELFDLVTTGLDAFDRRELAIRGVPAGDVENAGGLINLVAEYVVETPVTDGERLGMEYPGAAIIVRLFDEPGESKRGLFGFGRSRSKGVGVQLIADAHMDAPELPRCSLANIARLRAEALLDSDAPEDGVALLVASLEAWPGTPGNDSEPESPLPYNWENARTYLRLSELANDPDHQELMLRAAVERSYAVALETLGAEVEELVEITRDEVHERASSIVEFWLARDDTPEDEDEMEADGGSRIVRGPLWHRGDSGEVVMGLVMLPAALAERYVKAAPPAGADELVAFLTDTFTDAISDPIRLALALRDTIEIFEDANAPCFPSPFPYSPVDLLLSGLLAHTLRLGAFAELDVVRASLAPGAQDDGRVIECMAQVQAFEHEAFMAAMGSMMA